ncbi:TPA: flavocytochrome c [Photobacterium damselae]
MDKNKKTSLISRRRLLTSSVLIAASSSITTKSVLASPKNFEHPMHRIYDIIVIGSGFAGLAAALSAKELSPQSSIIVIDKMPSFGGNSAINGGAFAVAGSPLQIEQGIKDSPELMFQDMLKAGRGLNHQGLLNIIVNGTASAFNFAVKHGAKFKPFVQHFGGHSVPRVMQTIESSGGGIIKPFIKSARSMGIRLQSRCKLEEFILDDKQRVVGIEVRERYDFPNDNSGVIKRLGARQGVIVATGGFSQNISYRKSQNPNLNEQLDSTNHPGATGDGMLKLFELGASPTQVNLIQLGPWSSPDEKGFGYCSQFNTIAGFPKGIMVDTRTGQRFVNELADRKARSEAILTRRDRDNNPVYPISFTDKKGAEKAQSLKHALHYNVAFKFDSITSMANHFEIPIDGLTQQISLYNQMVKEGTDHQFQKPLENAHPLTPPFYAVRVWPKVHYTMGGAEIDTKGRVIHAQTRQPINGLFACGEVTGGPHGASRLGACAIAEGMVMGLLVGSEVTKMPIKSNISKDA